eukprot:3471375-Prymnesium_polylepis.1
MQTGHTYAGQTFGTQSAVARHCVPLGRTLGAALPRFALTGLRPRERQPCAMQLKTEGARTKCAQSEHQRRWPARNRSGEHARPPASHTVDPTHVEHQLRQLHCAKPTSGIVLHAVPANAL